MSRGTSARSGPTDVGPDLVHPGLNSGVGPPGGPPTSGRIRLMPSDSDLPPNEPNLELPSFGFGRKKKRAQKAADAGSGPSVTGDVGGHDDDDAPEDTGPWDDANST